MKQGLVKNTRKLLPPGAVRRLEEGYRRSRARLVGTRYGNPAHSLRVIAVTGTNGKTSTAHFIEAGLAAAGECTGLISGARRLTARRVGRSRGLRAAAPGAGFRLPPAAPVPGVGPDRGASHPFRHRARNSKGRTRWLVRSTSGATSSPPRGCGSCSSTTRRCRS